MTNSSSSARLSQTLLELCGPDQTVGVIIVDHGSRREESNRMLADVVQMFREATQLDIVEAAHMELAEPSLATALGRCVARGATLIVVYPHFLLPGRHWHSDIPRLTAEAARQHGNIRHLVAAPLALHPLLAEIIAQRLEQCLRKCLADGNSCEVCGEAGGCQLTDT